MTCQPSKLAFVTFSRGQNEKRFYEYLRIKHDVFVDEMNWDRIPHVKAHRIALADPYDDQGIFCGASDQVGRLVAVARGTLAKRFADMYRAQWYSHFAMLDFVKALEGKIGTINAVAVRREYRWMCKRDSLQQIRVSDLLMKNTVSELANIGANVILLSAISGPAYSLMRRIGVKIINRPHVLLARDYSTKKDAPDLTLFDMAIITRTTPTSGGHPLNQLNDYLTQTDEAFLI